jgi:superfamily II DNA or RNA helicase
MKVWDGKVRLFNLKDRTLPFGLYPDLLKWALTQNIKVIETSQVMPTVPLTDEEIEEFAMDKLSLPFEPRDYQVNSTIEALRIGRRLIISPTGSGKSLIMHIITQYLEREMGFKNILIVVPTVSLVTQLKSDFTEYAVNDEEFDPDNILLVPNAKKIKWDPTKNITITTWQSMMSVVKGEDAEEFFSKYEALLVDEVHTMAANVAKEIALMCSHTPVKIGMTGTLSNTKSGELALKGLFGAPYHTTTTADLIEDGTLTDVKIKAIQVTHEGLVDKMNYHSEIEYIRNSTVRNQFICKLANKVSDTGNTLILYQNLDQGQYLFDWLVANTTNKSVFFINGAAKADAREESRKFTDANDDVIIVASYQLMSTGVNIKNLHNLILASPTKSMIRLLQSVGRTLRKHESKDQAVVYDLYDVLTYRKKSDKSFGVSHFTERYKIYNQAKLSVDLIKGPLITVTPE